MIIQCHGIQRMSDEEVFDLETFLELAPGYRMVSFEAGTGCVRVSRHRCVRRPGISLVFRALTHIHG